MVINNTGTDLSMFDGAIRDAIANGGTLCEELADLLTLTPVDVNGETRWRVEWA